MDYVCSHLLKWLKHPHFVDLHQYDDVSVELPSFEYIGIHSLCFYLPVSSALFKWRVDAHIWNVEVNDRWDDNLLQDINLYVHGHLDLQHCWLHLTCFYDSFIHWLFTWYTRLGHCPPRIHYAHFRAGFTIFGAIRPNKPGLKLEFLNLRNKLYNTHIELYNIHVLKLLIIN